MIERIRDKIIDSKVTLPTDEEVSADRIQIATHCRFCEFRMNDSEGVQVGCEANVLDNLTLNGAEVYHYEVDDEHGKDNYLVVDNRICPYRRPNGWKDVKAKLLSDDRSYVDIAYEELCVVPDVIVFLAPGHTVDDLLKTTYSIQNQTHKVNKILFINFAGITPTQFSRAKSELTKRATMYAMEYMMIPPRLDENNQFDFTATRHLAADFAVKKIKSSHFAIVDAGIELPSDYVENMNKTLFKKLERMILSLPDGKEQGMFTSTQIFKQLAGNVGMSYVDKVLEKMEVKQCPQLVKTHS